MTLDKMLLKQPLKYSVLISMAFGSLFHSGHAWGMPKVQIIDEQLHLNLSARESQLISEHFESVDGGKRSLKNLELVGAAEQTPFQAQSDPQLQKLTRDKSCWKPRFDPRIPKVNWWDKLNPIWWIGNADTPHAPEWYMPKQPLRGLMWYFRNPLHNFTNYVIGIKDLSNKPDFLRCGDYPKEVFSPNPGWNFSTVQYGLIRLPFVSYWNKRAKVYIGWRERGNFGIKINRVK